MSDVDIKGAVDEFHNLEHELEADEAKANQDATFASGAGIEAGSEFNIREFFEESVRQEESKGHKPKRMGLVVKDLTVVGMGSDAVHIQDNLSPLKSLWPGNWYRPRFASNVF